MSSVSWVWVGTFLIFLGVDIDRDDGGYKNGDTRRRDEADVMDELEWVFQWDGSVSDVMTR